mgnify:CR=1 FL=1
MKLRTRLVISFCIIIFVPIIMAAIGLYAINTILPTLNIQWSSTSYEYIAHLPDFKNLVVDVMISVILILFFTAAILVIWTYSGIISRLRQLNKAAENIRDGNLDFSIDTKGHDEISELSESFEAMRKRLQMNAQEKLDAEQEHRMLISNIAHDLKTPITAIKGYSEGILDGVADTPEKQERYLKTIYNKANEMNTLINELTLYSNIDTNKIPYNFHKLNVKDYFTDCMEELEMDLENQHMQLTFFNYVDEDTLMIADPEQLGRVIHNIIGNAIKYGAEGKRILVKVMADTDEVQVSVTNYGYVIPAEELPLIFDKFYRVEQSRSTHTGGTGLGLAIVKNIVDMHGGTITVKSDLNGTVFTVTLQVDFDVDKEHF